MQRLQKHSLFLALSALLAFPACQSFDGPLVVDLFDGADPAGIIEIEMNRDGSIREIEADVLVDDLPKVVVQAALAQAPGGEVLGGEREYRGDVANWEVKIRLDGKDWEFIVDEDGNVIETEEPIEAAEAPEGIVAAALVRVPEGAQLKSVERIKYGETTEFHVNHTLDGATYKVVLDDAANVIRAVREQRAEIEIPLR